MAGLQRSAISFRRQGSSGLIWDDKLLSGELNQMNQKEDNDKEDDRQREEPEQQQQEINELKPSRTVGSTNTLDRSRSNGGGGAFRTGKASPAIEPPPSPKVSACGFCSASGKPDKTRRRRKSATKSSS
ncbi:hypothetical protein F0562_024607 [Nyssa sinensis]|uniref:MAPK kinase substrate protein n=1 Tax=Nyssa sinensis TaxID=561372 RepID=A0A5J5BCT9_9ASTE|nr:hypothetical protein F0562_024607 [Nyssa sinensis]